MRDGSAQVDSDSCSEVLGRQGVISALLNSDQVAEIVQNSGEKGKVTGTSAS